MNHKIHFGQSLLFLHLRNTYLNSPHVTLTSISIKLKHNFNISETIKADFQTRHRKLIVKICLLVASNLSINFK